MLHTFTGYVIEGKRCCIWCAWALEQSAGHQLDKERTEEVEMCAHCGLEMFGIAEPNDAPKHRKRRAA